MVGLKRSTVSATLGAVAQRSSRMLVAPIRSAANMLPMRIGEMKARGREQAVRRACSRAPARNIRAQMPTLPWRCSTAFGGPVVPDVITQNAGSVGLRGDRRLATPRARAFQARKLALAAQQFRLRRRPPRWRQPQLGELAIDHEHRAAARSPGFAQARRRWRGSTSRPRSRPPPWRPDAARRCRACRASAWRRDRPDARRPRAAPPANWLTRAASAP